MSRSTPLKIFAIVLLISVGFAVSLSAQEEKTEQDFLQHKSVLVQAYLVQVPNEVLYQAGAAALPKDDSESITVAKLISCLAQSENAAVIDTTRVAVKNAENAEVSTTQTNYLPRTQTVPSRQAAGLAAGALSNEAAVSVFFGGCSSNARERNGLKSIVWISAESVR